MLRLGLVLLSAFLSYLAFPNMFSIEGYPFLIWAALVPFLWALEGRPLMGRLLYGLVWGAVFFLLVTRWLFAVSPAGYLLFVLALALGPMVFVLLPLRSSGASLRFLLYVPSVWAVSEFLRSWAMGGFTWSLAYSQAFHPEHIRLACFGGAYAVVWVVVFVNTAVYLALRSSGLRRKKMFFAALAAFLLNAGFGTLSFKPAAGEKDAWRVALIQPDISRDDKSDTALYDVNAERHLALSDKSVEAYQPELIVWPETSFPDDLLRDALWRSRMEGSARKWRAGILAGSALQDDRGRDLNAGLLLSSRGQWKARYIKRKLVPFSENAAPFPWTWMNRLAKVQGRDFVPGDGTGIMSLLRDREPFVRFMGVVICSEEAYPSLFREIASRGASFITVMLNDAWFRLPEALVMHAQNAAFRAVESGRPVLRAGNTGLTAAFGPDGRLTAGPLPLNSAGSLKADVVPASGKTFYTRFGDVFLLPCLLLIAMYHYCRGGLWPPGTAE